MDLVDSFSSEEHDGRVATLSGEEEVEVIVKNIRDPQDLCAIPSNVQRWLFGARFFESFVRLMTGCLFGLQLARVCK